MAKLTNSRVSSLQELFCAAEALWPPENDLQTLVATLEMQLEHARDATRAARAQTQEALQATAQQGFDSDQDSEGSGDY